MKKSKLISKNTALVSVSDIKKSGNILSAEYHINALKNKSPYILKEGKYVLALPHQIKKAEYYTRIQVNHINNLLFAMSEIQSEIDKIKKTEKYELDEKISESRLSPRAKTICYVLAGSENGTLSDVALIPVVNWLIKRGMGIGTMREIRAYLISSGFSLIKGK